MHNIRTRLTQSAEIKQLLSRSTCHGCLAGRSGVSGQTWIEKSRKKSLRAVSLLVLDEFPFDVTLSTMKRHVLVGDANSISVKNKN